MSITPSMSFINQYLIGTFRLYFPISIYFYKVRHKSLLCDVVWSRIIYPKDKLAITFTFLCKCNCAFCHADANVLSAMHYDLSLNALIDLFFPHNLSHCRFSAHSSLQGCIGIWSQKKSIFMWTHMLATIPHNAQKCYDLVFLLRRQLFLLLKLLREQLLPHYKITSVV